MPSLQPEKDKKPDQERPRRPGRKPPGGKEKPDKKPKPPTEDQIVKGGDGSSDHPN